MSQQHFSELERGRANATVDTIASIAMALDVKIAELFRADDG